MFNYDHRQNLSGTLSQDGSYVNLKLKILATLCDFSFTSVTN